MTEELIGALARVPGLRVAARSSVFALKGRQLDVREAGELLRAATVLEGSVRRDGQRLQVSAQLIDARDGYLIWGEEFDRDLADVFAVQDEIARAIVDALRIQLMPTSAALVPRRTENLEAYRAYAKGRHFIRMRGGDGTDLAVGLFERAIALDSGYAQAWAGLAEAHTRLAQLGYAPAQEEDKAASIAALAALELDSTLAEAHRALAHIRCAREWKWSEAEREYQRALALDPQDVATHELYGLCLVAQGKFHAARSLFVGAYELDPLQPFTSNLLGRFYLEAGQPDSAIHYLEEAVELGPDLDLAHQQLGHAYLKVGRNEEAIASFLRAAALTGARDSAHLAYAYAVTGRKVEARAILQHLIEANREHPPVVDLALGFSGLGDADEAFRWLERGFDEHAPFMDHIMVASGFEPLRSDPRFTRLLARMGLTPGHGPRP
jgi:serine/threonine-protein kinase